MTWDAIIDRLIDIGRNVDDFVAEGMTPPSRATVALAAKLATAMRNDGYLPPDRIVPNAGGGIVFERAAGKLYETICVPDDSTIEYCSYASGRLCHQKRWRKAQ